MVQFNILFCPCRSMERKDNHDKQEKSKYTCYSLFVFHHTCMFLLSDGKYCITNIQYLQNFFSEKLFTASCGKVADKMNAISSHETHSLKI